MINNHLQGNLKAREVAMASGTFRNPAKTASQQQQRNQAFKQATTAVGAGLTGPAIKLSSQEFLLGNKQKQNPTPPK